MLGVIWQVLGEFSLPDTKILDPFAGIGQIHQLWPDYETWGIELEREWAGQDPHTVVGNALHLPFGDGTFGAIVTSPCYGNRMADSHVATDDSVRHTYTHTLGRKLHPDNAGAMQWGDDYRLFHTGAALEAIRVLEPGGLFVLNMSDHIRNFEVQPVTRWWTRMLRIGGGLVQLDRVDVPTRRQRHGENGAARSPVESVLVFARPDP